MNRRTWWTALLAACGVAKAQTGTIQITDAPKEPCPNCIPITIAPADRPRPRNNECPVCGTMAKPYERSSDEIFRESNIHYHHEPDGRVVAAPLRRVKAANLTRCEWCNCAFWQDEETQ